MQQKLIKYESIKLLRMSILLVSSAKSQQSLFVGDLADFSSEYPASCTPLDSFYDRSQFDTSGRPHICGIREL